jgi:hypothetical protein
MQYMMNAGVSREEMRASCVSNIIALSELIVLDEPNITDKGKRIFLEAIRLEARNLKDIDFENADSSSDLSTIDNSGSGATDLNNSREVTSARLLDNVIALGELAEMRTTSEAAKRLFWEAIKLELRTFTYLNDNDNENSTENDNDNETECAKKTTCEHPKGLDTTVNTATTIKLINSDSGSNPSSDGVLSNSSRFVVLVETNDEPTKPMRKRERCPLTKLSCTGGHSKLEDSCVTKAATDANSHAASGTCVSSSSPTSGNESKASSQKKERNRVRPIPYLPLLFQKSVSAQKEWLRSDQGPLQENGEMENRVMEMVFYLTSKEDGMHTVTTNE